MSLKTLRSLLLCVGVCCLLLPVRAQDEEAPPEEPPAPVVVDPAQDGQPPETAPEEAPIDTSAARIFTADEEHFAQLPGALRTAGAVSVRVTRASLEANEPALNGLLAWVRRGGLVFLHNDAAELFGYTTVPARERTNEQAGQFFGRARAALPFNASPLLADDGMNSRAAALQRAAPDPNRLPGVNVVFYELGEGDHLVAGHPAATPLLEVTDLASNGTGTPLYAAAIAPYGSGWAVFTPDSIDNRRADGALFLRNLLRLIPGAGGRQGYVGVAASVVTQASDNGGNVNELLKQLKAVGGGSAPALPALGTVPRTAPPAPVVPPPAPAADEAADNGDEPAPVAVRDEPRLLLTAADATGFASVIGGADAARRTAAIQLLRARLEWQQQNNENATARLDQAEQTFPGSAEVAYWRGCLWAGASQELNQPSPQRAEEVGQAAQSWAAAQTAPRLVPPQVGGAGARDIPLVQASWIPWFQSLAAMYGAEPPRVQQLGTGDAAITLRFFDDDPSFNLILEGTTALAQARTLGWRVDREEVLLFPTPEYYAAYRRATGQVRQSVPLPAASIGDVIGARVLMVAIPSFPTFTRDAAGHIIPFVAGGAGANILARLHSYALMNAMTEDGTQPPAWMRLGLEALLSVIIEGGEVSSLQDTLRPFAAAGGLLTPQQFAAARAGGAEAPDVAEAQATALMIYFYQEHGAGMVAETMQRLGQRESADDALQDTVEVNQLGFFQNWRDSFFGPQNFPNQG